MVKSKEKFKKIIFSIAIFLYGCANQLPPSGGSVDTLPPEIIFIYPESGTINYSENYFKVEFSEYVDKRSFKEAIFISPAVEGGYDISWTNRTATVNFKNKLRLNTTYSITIGTDVVDYNNRNNMASAVSLTFSTGNKIDSGLVQGVVYDKDPLGIMIFAYIIDSTDINPSIRKPDYLTQTGKDGSFVLSGLADGNYRFFAVKDENRNLLFTPPNELIGIPQKDVIISGLDSTLEKLTFKLSKLDTIPPVLTKAIMPDRNHIILTYSEEIEVNGLTNTNFILFDSLNSSALDIPYIFRGRGKENEIVLSVEGNVTDINILFISSNNVKDKNGNLSKLETLEVEGNDRIDTLPPALIKSKPSNRENNIDFLNTTVTLFFDDGIDTTIAREAFRFVDTAKNEIPHSIYFPDAATVMLKANDRIASGEIFILGYDRSKLIDVAGNKIDTIETISFTTLPGLDFTGLSGKIVIGKNFVNKIDNSNIVLSLQHETDKELFYKTKPNRDNTFYFERIRPGKYFLSAIIDDDDDGEYSYGSIIPFIPSERIFFFFEKINLPPRWAVTELEFVLE